MLAAYYPDTPVMSNDYSEPGAGQSRPRPQSQLPPPPTLPAPPQMAALPHPSVGLQTPGLSFEFRMAARLRGDVCRVRLRNEGVRDLSVVEGGEWVAGFGRGTVRVSGHLPPPKRRAWEESMGQAANGVHQSGGHDLQTSQPPERTRTRVDTAFELETDDEPPAKYVSELRLLLAQLLPPHAAQLDF